MSCKITINKITKVKMFYLFKVPVGILAGFQCEDIVFGTFMDEKSLLILKICGQIVLCKLVVCKLWNVNLSGKNLVHIFFHGNKNTIFFLLKHILVVKLPSLNAKHYFGCNLNIDGHSWSITAESFLCMSRLNTKNVLGKSSHSLFLTIKFL